MSEGGYKYFMDSATVHLGGSVQDILRIWADSELIWHHKRWERIKLRLRRIYYRVFPSRKPKKRWS